MVENIEFKLIQALLVWREKGGPQSIPVSEATKIMQESGNSITESEMRSIVTSSSALDLKGDEIVLNSKVTDVL